jgi:hypothetical protein
MHCAVIVALGDPCSSDAGMWVDAVAWLRQELTELQYRVTVIDGDEVERDLTLALDELGPDDDVFLHVSGRLVDRGVVRTSGGHWVRLEAIGDMLAARALASVSIFAELQYGGPEDAGVAATHVASIVGDLGAQARETTVLAGVRAAASSVDGLALTRLFREVARAVGPQDALLSSAIYQRVTDSPQVRACAQSVRFVAGRERQPSQASQPASSVLPALQALPSFESEPPPGVESVPPPPIDSTENDPDAPSNSNRDQCLHMVDLRRERLRTITSRRARIRELVAIARTLQVDLDDAEGAIAALEEARAIDPMRVGVLQALRRGYERVGRWEHALEAIGALAELSVSPTDRAELRLSQARIALDRLHDDDRAFAWLQNALENDPAHDRALAAFETLCARRAQTARTPSEGAEETRPKPHDPLASQDAISSLPPAMSDASEHEGKGNLAGDDPTDAAKYVDAFAVHWREGRTDAALLAALALEELGASDVDQQILVDQFRTVAPIRARGTLDASAWELLRGAGSNGALETVFAHVARAAVAARLDQLVSRQRLVALDAANRLDDGSTASVVRSFQWAARVLGVECPALYVVDDVPGDIAAVRAHQPSTAVGPSVLRGRSAKDLAFLAGRHLTYYLPEHQVVVYFPTSADLARLLMATIELGTPGASGAARDPAVAGLRDRLRHRATTAERAAIAAAARHLDPRADLTGWARSVELTATRAGLLLCGDLATASTIVRAEARAIAGLSPDDRRRDLIAFCSSPQHTELRARFAVTAPESQQPPPAPAARPSRNADPPQDAP